MPFNVALATQTMIESAVATASSGLLWPNVSIAISNACAATFVAPGTVTVPIVSGLAPGPGILTSGSPVVGIEPAAMAASIVGTMASFGLAGADTLKTALNISAGVVVGFTQMVVVGAVIGVGPGAGTAKVTGIAGPALGAAILQQMVTQGLVGTENARWAQAVGLGIANYINATAVIPVVLSAGPAVVPPVPASSFTLASLA